MEEDVSQVAAHLLVLVSMDSMDQFANTVSFDFFFLKFFF